MLIINLSFVALFLVISFLVFYGWGSAFANLLLKESKNYYFSSYILLGIICVTFLIQISHIFFPVDWKISTFYYLTGLFLMFRQKDFLVSNCVNFFVWIKRNIFLIPPVIVIVIYWSLRIMKLPTNYDTAAYHLQTIRWINSYPLIPGLGNLDTHIAFNQSYFDLLSLFRFFPFFQHGFAIGSILFFILLGISIFERLNTKYIHITVLAMLIYLINHSAGSTLFSPTPDLVVSILEVIIFSFFVELIAVENTIRKKNELIFLITLIACYLFTIKLTAAIFTFGIFLLTLKFTFSNIKLHKSTLLTAILFSIFFIIVHLYSGYILTGYPFFPLSFGGLHSLAWSVPREILTSDVDSIYNASKKIDGLYGGNAKYIEWIPLWYLKQNVTYKFFLNSTLFLLIANLFSFSLRNIKFDKNVFSIAVICIVSITTWFITAPDIRYLGSILDIFCAILFVAFLNIYNFSRIYTIFKTYIFRFALFTILAFSSLTLNSMLLDGWDKLPDVPSEPIILDTNLRINLSSELCWDSEIPCLNRVNKSLRLIKDGDVKSGFILLH